MKGIIGELEKNPEIILFIDEIHTLVGAGGDWVFRCIKYVKPAYTGRIAMYWSNNFR